jgi:glycosyltransferase involved in cell wall biosynthesis
MKKLLVVMPLYNEEKLLKRAVNSVLDQTYTNFSLVIVNDCSTDNSLEEANKFLYDKRVTVINNEKNQGAYYSKNVGLRLLENKEFDLYTIHDADDFSLLNRFEKMINVFELNEDIVCVQDFELRIGNNPPSWYGPIHQEMRNIAHPFYTKEIFEKLGYYDNTLYSGDEDYFNRLNNYCHLNKKINCNLDEVLYYAEITNDNAILTYDDKLREIYRKSFRIEIEKMNKNNNFYRKFFEYSKEDNNNIGLV